MGNTEKLSIYLHNQIGYMKIFKATARFIFRRHIVAVLFAANLIAFTLTAGYFSNYATAEDGSKKSLVRKINTGWQILDRSFSLIDYFRNVGDRKN